MPLQQCLHRQLSGTHWHILLWDLSKTWQSKTASLIPLQHLIPCCHFFFLPRIRTNCMWFHTICVTNTEHAGWHEHTAQHCLHREARAHHTPPWAITAVLLDQTSSKVKDQNAITLTCHRSVTFFCPVAGSSVIVLQNSGPCKGAATLQFWKDSVTSQPETGHTTWAQPAGTSTLDIFDSCIGWSAPVAPVAQTIQGSAADLNNIFNTELHFYHSWSCWYTQNFIQL